MPHRPTCKQGEHITAGVQNTCDFLGIEVRPQNACTADANRSTLGDLISFNCHTGRCKVSLEILIQPPSTGNLKNLRSLELKQRHIQRQLALLAVSLIAGSVKELLRGSESGLQVCGFECLASPSACAISESDNPTRVQHRWCSETCLTNARRRFDTRSGTCQTTNGAYIISTRHCPAVHFI